MNAGTQVLNRFVDYVIDPIILLIFAGGFFMFVLGLVQFLWGVKSGEVDNNGKQHMIWGIVGMLIMVSVYGIIALIDETFDLDFSNPDVSRMDNIAPPANFFGN